ncbi:glycosyltransferase family 2 protein [Phocaeicola plebeius]
MKYNYQDNLVSLVTPGWNGKQFVHRLLDSIIAQTYRPIEYIYVDDGSTDGTAEIVQSYKEQFKNAGIDFKFIQQKNGGVSEALMTGFQHVTGKYLSCPEYDDILLPTSVEKRIQYLQNHPDCAVVSADAWGVTEANIEERKNKISHNNPNRFDRNHFYQALMSNSIFNAACNMLRMDLFDQTHTDRKIFSSRIAPNQQILLPLYFHYNRGFIDEPLSIFLIRQGSVSHPQKTLEIELNRGIEYRNILFHTLESINMPNDLLELYKRRVEINVQKDFVLFGYIYNDLALLENGLRFLEQHNEAIPEYYLYRKKMKSKLFQFRRYISRKIK